MKTLRKTLRLIATTALFLVIYVPSTFAQGGSVAISVVQSLTAGVSTDGGTNPSGTFSGAQTAGDSNYIMVEYWPPSAPLTGPVTSVTDAQGNIYTRQCGPLTTISSGSYTNECGGGNPTADGNDTIVEMWLANSIKAADAGANTVTMQMTNPGHMVGWNMWLLEIHIATAGSILALDKFVSTQTNSSSPTGISTGTTATTTSPNEIFIAWCLPVSGLCQPSPSSPWVDMPLSGGEDFDTHSGAAYLIATSEQTASALFGAGSTNGDEAIAGILTFKSVPPANLPKPPTSLTATVQ